MRKLILLTVFLFAALSCGTPKTVIQSKKVMKGFWNLDNISYQAPGKYKISLLDDATSECFEGSTWRFIPNNNSGIYTINNVECQTGDRNFIFTIAEIDQATGLYDFLLKPTVKQGSANKTEKTGYRLQLTQLSDTNMQWQQTVAVDGKPFTLSMNFSKSE